MYERRMRLLPLLCSQLSLLAAPSRRRWYFFFSYSFFTLFSLRASFSQILSKKNLSLTDDPPAKKTERSGERDLKMRLISLKTPRFSLERLPFFLALLFSLLFSRWAKWKFTLFPIGWSLRTNEWFQSVSLIFFVFFSDPTCVRLKRLSVLTTTQMKFFRTLSHSLLSLSKRFLNKTRLPNAFGRRQHKETLSRALVEEHFFVRFCSRNAL